MLEPAVPSDPGSRPSRRPDAAPIAVLLLGLGIVLAVLYAVFDGSEHHSYNSGALAADTVHLTAGRNYEISTPGGVKALAARGGDPNIVSCSYRLPSGVSAPLQVSALGASTRTVHAIASFVSPVTGKIHVDCQALAGGAYVDNADDAATDWSGLFILLSAICLTGAAAFGMSALYRRSTERARDQHEVQAQVDVRLVGGEHEEVLDRDGRDVGDQPR